MTAADIPVMSSPQEDGQLGVWFPEDREIWWRAPRADNPQGGFSSSFHGVEEGDREARDEFAAGEGYGLVVDGVDRSDDYTRCLEESAYFAPVVDEVALQEEQARMNRLSAEATNDFAACARENGYPSLPDVDSAGTSDVPGGLNAPEAVELPLAMGTEELRELLEVCHVYDPDPAIPRAIWDGVGAHDPILAAIHIESPEGGIGDGRLETDPEARHGAELGEVLAEAESAFWEAWREQNPEE
jgi:hypothetical protein